MTKCIIEYNQRLLITIQFWRGYLSGIYEVLIRCFIFTEIMDYTIRWNENIFVVAEYLDFFFIIFESSNKTMKIGKISVFWVLCFEYRVICIMICDCYKKFFEIDFRNFCYIYILPLPPYIEINYIEIALN